ncbi:MFS transporter [Nonomuraea sp. NPDC049649]|uniref:MFS transporter n=1 Tax=Nonomuraea sp. NPDC049649 TaxID=3155776 RepID=UPI0034315080
MSATRHWPGVIAASLTATATVMPGFTVGALAPALEADLHIPTTTVGLAMSAFYAATALGSPLAKRVAARLPIPITLAAASVLASATMLLAAQVTSAAALFATLLAGGLGNGLVQPAASRFIAERSPSRRRSLAAGIVGAALGAATLVPGLLVAFVVQPYGWRAALTIAALLALVPAALAPLTRGGLPARAVQPVRAARSRALVLWAVAAALSATGNNAVASYFVQLGTHSGLATDVTGTLLAMSAVIAIAVRLIAGALTDRAPRHNPAVITAMMLSGGAGLALISLGSPATFLIGAVLAFSAGWGWTGLLLASAIHLLPGRAENAGHLVQVGIYTGATVAPFGFGALSAALGITGATLTAAAATFIAAVLIAADASLLARPITGAQPVPGTPVG